MAQFEDKYLPITKEALQQIPESLKAAPRWLCWGGEKVPVTVRKNSGGYHSGANVTNPEIWGSFADAVSAIGEECFVKSTEEYFHVAGVGFVVGDGWFCADLDGGQAHGGKEDVPESAIKAALDQTGTYAERSVSGCGFHVFGKCDFSTSEAENNKPHRDAAGKPVPESYEVEFFTRRKFIAITGNRVPEANTDAIECSSGANSFYTDFILNDWQRDEAKRAEAYRKTVQAAPASLEEKERFFLMNYPEILAYSDSSNFKRDSKNGGYSWIGAVKAMQELGIPYDAILGWCKHGSNFRNERDVQKVLKESRSSNSRKATVGSLIKDAMENGWKPDPEKLTGEYKEKHDRKKEEEESFAEFIKEYNEQTQKAFEAIGIKPSCEMRWKTNPDGSIAEIVNKETGEILYPKSEEVSGNKTLGIQESANKVNAVTVKDLLKDKVSDYSEVKIKPTEYMFFPWFPRGKVTIIQGDSGSAKSTFMYGVVAKVTSGDNLLGVPCENPGNAMVLTLEDSEDEIKIAVGDSGGIVQETENSPGCLKKLDRKEIAKLNLANENGIRIIEALIVYYNLKMLVLDPLQHFLKGDMNKANETRGQLAKLTEVAEAHDTTIVIIQHTGKDTSKSALHRGVGSVDIVAISRSLLQVVADPEGHDYRIAFTVKNNTAAKSDVSKAIRYAVRDHPNSWNPESLKYDHYHGHAEFVELLPDYDERKYKKALREAEESDLEAAILQFGYSNDPLTVTVEKLIAENPNGLFIGTDDLIAKVTEVNGFCPYTAGKDQVTGIYARIRKIREVMIRESGIQADIQGNPILPKAYNWNSDLFQPTGGRVRGIQLTPVKGVRGGNQQTKI